MRDGGMLALDICRPKDSDCRFQAIFVKLPRDFNRIEGTDYNETEDASVRNTARRCGRRPGRIELPRILQLASNQDRE